jgi:hypothetical protein
MFDELKRFLGQAFPQASPVLVGAGGNGREIPLHLALRETRPSSSLPQTAALRPRPAAKPYLGYLAADDLLQSSQPFRFICHDLHSDQDLSLPAFHEEEICRAGGAVIHPDGQSIFYSQQVSQRRSDIYQLDLAGNQVLRLTNKDSYKFNLAVAADGKILIWAEIAADRSRLVALWLSEPGEPRVLESRNRFDHYLLRPRLSPDSQRLAYVERKDLAAPPYNFERYLDCLKERALSGQGRTHYLPAAAENRVISTPAYQPGSDALFFFESDYANRRIRLYRTLSGSLADKALVFEEEGAVEEVLFPIEDSRSLIYLKRPLERGDRYRLFSRSPDGDNEKRLTQDEPAARWIHSLSAANVPALKN